jgi:hypothetical protein
MMIAWKTNRIRIRVSTLLILMSQIASCADSPRQNIVDPVNTPTIEMSAPVLDGGTVFIQWRYLSEGAALSEFQVTRTTGGIQTEINRVPARSASTVVWQTESLRDSVIAAGLEVTYQVTGFLVGGAESSSDSRSFTLPGTTFGLSTPDTDRARIRLNWTDPPAGTTGFDILRSAGDVSEVIHSTSNISDVLFEDAPPHGNVVYTYELITHLEGGATIRSDPVRKGLFTVTTSIPVLPGSAALRSRVNYIGGSSATVMYTRSQTLELYTATAGGEGASHHVGLMGYAPLSVSMTRSTQEHLSSGSPYSRYISYLNIAHDRAFFHALVGENDSLSVGVTLDWPASGGSNTGMTLFGSTLNGILVYAGHVIRELDASFEVLHQHQLNSEPIDIDYQDGAIWLAYADRLVKSNPVQALSSVTEFSDVSLPSGTRITAMSRFRELMAVLDGVNRQVLLLSADGDVLLTWDALGPALETADIEGHDQGNWIIQSDGDGFVHFMRADGLSFNEVFTDLP